MVWSNSGLKHMNKQEGYEAILTGLLDDFVKTERDEKIREYLASNSNLPGPRGNLELTYAFAKVTACESANHPHKMWALVQGLLDITPNQAPVNDPKEILPFCGAVAIGAIGSVNDAFGRTAFDRLRRAANDPRWRTREGVAMGLQRLIARQGQSALVELDNWIVGSEWLAMRAVAAGVAEPSILTDERIAADALELHKKIIAQMLASDERRTIEFRTLRQALGYSLSVVVRAAPRPGFDFLNKLAGSSDADIRWIMKENLKKNRLTSNFPKEVAELSNRLK